MNKIEVKPTTVKDFKDWAKSHQMPILCDDEKLARALNVVNERSRARGIKLSKEVKVKK